MRKKEEEKRKREREVVLSLVLTVRAWVSSSIPSAFLLYLSR